MQQRGDLGEYLFQRRSGLRPETVGLHLFDDRRRVSGLRREELARLAGVSPSYYARLEQGQSTNASAEVLDALARALQLDGDEHGHLRDLARARRPAPPADRPGPEHITPAIRDLLRAMVDVPAMVTGLTGDVLGWSPMWHALFAGHLDATSPGSPVERPNTAKLVFLDAHTRELYVDWPTKARAVVEHLRLTAGRHPDDSRLAALIGELTTRSSEFATLWAEHGVRTCDAAVHDLRHPVVGRVAVSQQTLRPAGASDQSLVVITFEEGSSSEAAMVLLCQVTATPDVDAGQSGRAPSTGTYSRASRSQPALSAPAS